MTAGRMVEPLDVVEHIRSGLVSCPIGFAAGNAHGLKDEKKLSIAAFVQTLRIGHVCRRCAGRPSAVVLLAGVRAALIGVVQ
jgi:hypothetical protein